MLYLHEDRLKELLEKDNTHPKDIERKTLFYILSGNTDLYKKINFIYDFKDHSIKPECLESGEVDFCSSSQKLIKLAFNLFNSIHSADVMGTLQGLDKESLELALNSISLRLGVQKQDNYVF